MLIGYARVSTLEAQEAGLEAQVRDLTRAGVEKMFQERASAVAGDRPTLRAALDYVREGDTLVVTKPCRLARSVADLLSIMSRLEAKRVNLLVLSMGGQPVDTRTPTGRLMLTLLGAISEFETALSRERQREGIEKSKQAGKYKGRAPTAQRQASEVKRLKSEGQRPTDIARHLRISRASVYRILAAA